MLVFVWVLRTQNDEQPNPIFLVLCNVTRALQQIAIYCDTITCYIGAAQQNACGAGQTRPARNTADLEVIKFAAVPKIETAQSKRMDGSVVRANSCVHAIFQPWIQQGGTLKPAAAPIRSAHPSIQSAGLAAAPRAGVAAGPGARGAARSRRSSSRRPKTRPRVPPTPGSHTASPL
jgi:heterodisulfide reductase subunit A-like polyferredoxin